MMSRPRQYLWATSFAVIILFAGSNLLAQTLKNQVGYTQLVSEYGVSLATGSGIRVGLVEADIPESPVNDPNTVTYWPQTGIPDFAGKSFFDLRPANSQTVQVSGHATNVGQNFFGINTSLSPGVTQIDVYEANDFVFFRQKFQTTSLPEITNVSVMNHSYIGTGARFAEANARLDFTVERDNFTSVVALNNGTGVMPELYGQSYNSIVVGRTDGQHTFGVTSVGGNGRTKPDIVAPEGSTSSATPVVSSAAALLHSAAAANSSLVDARNSEAMKAIIMAGATKTEFSSWTNTSTRPLDAVFGAGELNVLNSYKILIGGQQEGSILAPTQTSSLTGWDFQSTFNPANTTYWNFQIDAGQTISEASFLLTWNAMYSTNLNLAGTGLDFNLSLANMNLRLFDSTTSFLGTQLAESNSSVDNVEHIYLKNLGSGIYTLALSSNMNTSYGLAWNLTAVPEPNSFLLIGTTMLAMLYLRRRPVAYSSIA